MKNLTVTGLKYALSPNVRKVSFYLKNNLWERTRMPLYSNDIEYKKDYEKY